MAQRNQAQRNVFLKENLKPGNDGQTALFRGCFSWGKAISESDKKTEMQ